MAATEFLGQVIGLDGNKLSYHEKHIVEAELFVRICEGLMEFFREQYQSYFRLMKFTLEMENIMLEENFIRLVINDILSTEDYSVSGIACYTQSHEDVICDLVSGVNPTPSFPLSRKILELHRTVRPQLYREILKKINEDIESLAG